MPAVAERLRRSEVEQAPDFGAFIQVFEKRKDANGIPRISCLSYPLPPGVTPNRARQMMGDILGPRESNVVNIADYYRSPSGELQFMAREGATFTTAMRDRFLNIPSRELGIDQRERKKELVGKGVLLRFHKALQGELFESAQDSPGAQIFDFAYEVDKKTGKIYGKDRKGKRMEKSLGELAMDGDIEHEGMLIRLEERLQEMDEGVVINFDKSKTVSLCCALFFKEKFLEKMGVIRDATKEAIGNFLSLFFGREFALQLVKEEESREVCGKCGEEKAQCSGHS